MGEHEGVCESKGISIIILKRYCILFGALRLGLLPFAGVITIILRFAVEDLFTGYCVVVSVSCLSLSALFII